MRNTSMAGYNEAVVPTDLAYPHVFEPNLRHQDLGAYEVPRGVLMDLDDGYGPVPAFRD